MREPVFWHRPRNAIVRMLEPLAYVYGCVSAWRMRQPGRNVGIPVICVGSPTLGGAGKTPTALEIGRLLKEAGARPFYLSRGYGGRLSGPVVVDERRHGAADVGDEPLLLARVAPTVVARDRVAGASAARAAGASVVVMDDGFHNPSLVKNLSILVVDGRRGLGNGRMFPAGPLRAPLRVQIACAQAMIVIGGGEGAAAPIAAARESGLPVYSAHLQPDSADLAALKGCPVLAFSGIGDNEKFFSTLDAGGIDARIRCGFADHHAYSRAEIASLLTLANTKGLVPVTTEKDMVRICSRGDGAQLAATIRTLRVSLVLDDVPAFRALLQNASDGKPTV